MALDEADKKTIAELVAAALAANNTELEKKFVTPDAVTKTVEQGFAKGIEALKLDEKIGAAVKTAIPAPGAGDDKNKAGGKPAEGAGPSPELAKLNEKIEKLEKQNKEEAEARVAAERRNREQAMEAAAKDALAKAGIPAEKHPHALAYLRTLKTDDGKPVLDVKDDGSPLWRTQRKGYVDEATVTDGIKAWAGSDDGKHYLPPVGAKGDGGGAGGAGRGGQGGEVDPEAFVRGLLNSSLRSA